MPRTNSAALKTSAILLTAGALSAAALFLTQRAGSATSEPPPAAPAQHHSLSMAATLASSHLLAGNHVSYMAVSLTAEEQPYQNRPDIDVAVVFDRSGSMEGEKLSQAKLAARQLISGLASNDRFSITAYGTDVDVLFPSTIATKKAKAAALMTISQIYTDGGTNMSGGLVAGRSQLLGLGASEDRVQRIVLISDGQANEGIVGKDELAGLAAQSAQQGVSITTVGIGLDFDEQTMTRIAVSGRGNYYFAESADMLAQMFSTELSRLGATVATRIQLRIAPKPGVEIQEVLGYDTIRENGEFIINVADMHAGETRKVIVALQVDASASASTMGLVTTRAAFYETASGQVANLDQALSAEITKNQALVNEGRDKTANRLIERALTAKAIQQATELYEQGNRGEADQVMDTRNQAAQAIAADLGDAEFASEMEETQHRVKGNFAKAPASSTGGKRARKTNRKDAYKLMY